QNADTVTMVLDATDGGGDGGGDALDVVARAGGDDGGRGFVRAGDDAHLVGGDGGDGGDAGGVDGVAALEKERVGEPMLRFDAAVAREAVAALGRDEAAVVGG